MRFGTAVHAVLEQRYRGSEDAPRTAAALLGEDHPCYVSLQQAGWMSPAGKCAVAGLGYLPQPHGCFAVYPEQPAVLPGDPPIAGTRDLLAHLRPAERDRLGLRDDWLCVDYKTSSAPKWFARSARDLKRDAQGIIYPLSAMLDHGLDRIACRWLYLPSKPPHHGAQPTDFFQKKGAALDRSVADLRTRGKRILTIVSDPMQATRDPSACRSYGRLCPHHSSLGGPCNPKEPMAESLAERIARVRAEQAGTAAPAAEPPPAEEPKKRGRPRKAAEPASDPIEADTPMPPAAEASVKYMVELPLETQLRTPLTGTVERLQKTDDAATLVCIRVPMTGVFPIALGQEVEIV